MDSNRERIILAARRLFSEKGIYRTTLGDIAREAGIAKGTLYYYYQSKESLVFEVLDQGIGALLNSLDAASRETSLTTLVQRYLENLTSNQELVQIYFHLLQESFSNPVIRESFQHKYHEWREWSRVVLGRYNLNPSEEFSTLFIAALDGLCLQWLVEPKSINIEKLSAVIVDLFESKNI